MEHRKGNRFVFRFLLAVKSGSGRVRLLHSTRLALAARTPNAAAQHMRPDQPRPVSRNWAPNVGNCASRAKRPDERPGRARARRPRPSATARAPFPSSPTSRSRVCPKRTKPNERRVPGNRSPVPRRKDQSRSYTLASVFVLLTSASRVGSSRSSGRAIKKKSERAAAANFKC